MQYQQKKITSPLFFPSIIFVGWLLFGGLSARGAEEVPVSPTPATLSCVVKDVSPQTVSEKTTGGIAFTLVRGQVPAFLCIAGNTDSEKPLTVSLTGKQMSGSLPAALAVSQVSLAAGASAEVPLQFPVVFQPGSYYYVFSLTDTTGQSLAREVVLEGTLRGAAQPRIAAVIPNSTKYAWGEPLAVMVSLTLPEKFELSPGTLFIDLALQDKTGAACGTVAKHQSISQMEDIYRLTLEQSGTCANGLEVTLTTEDGTVIDRKVVAIGLPEMKLPLSQKTSSITGWLSDMSMLLKGALILTGVLILALVGYFLMKKRQRHF